MPTVETAAVAAITYAALFAGHHLGDHPLQSTAAATGKAAPGTDELARGAHAWRGWSWCARHVAVYTAVQAACLALVSVVAPLSLIGAIAALAVSASTHAVIDRRWVVRWFLDAKGAHDWTEGPYLVDQSLHLGMLLVAAVVAAGVTGPTGLAVTLVASTAVVAAGLLVERHRARAAVPAPLVARARH
ncbi:DUF3307 domain-containing protein [Actinocatenispora rupis]|uniref:DUF3307 domain-containing protein n=1 Tax=Actinocatenispora rupis TaxID=519421 RepID=A0A8J3NBQ2_9ACTN|nr:DUF3307 domain-containing protein [Actinocatenispora rupis]GID09584.1 hypothetical protein Aru02nite_04730 [Actinocatenispora rupis]